MHASMLTLTINGSARAYIGCETGMNENCFTWPVDKIVSA
jgi:hypothetical protein